MKEITTNINLSKKLDTTPTIENDNKTVIVKTDTSKKVIDLLNLEEELQEIKEKSILMELELAEIFKLNRERINKLMEDYKTPLTLAGEMKRFEDITASDKIKFN